MVDVKSQCNTPMDLEVTVFPSMVCDQTTLFSNLRPLISSSTKETHPGVVFPAGHAVEESSWAISLQ